MYNLLKIQDEEEKIRKNDLCGTKQDAQAGRERKKAQHPRIALPKEKNTLLK